MYWARREIPGYFFHKNPKKRDLFINCVIEITRYSILISKKNLSEFHCSSNKKKIYFIAHVLTPWSRVVLEKLTGSQVVKEFPTFNGSRRFITAFTSARHLSYLFFVTKKINLHSLSYPGILVLDLERIFHLL
jgi:hypothetical protein